MADITYDVGDLDSLAANLMTIKNSFDNAEKFSDAVSNAVGNAMLAGKVQDFADQWNDKRREMGEKVSDMATFVGNTRDAFQKVDSELAKLSD